MRCPHTIVAEDSGKEEWQEDVDRKLSSELGWVCFTLTVLRLVFLENGAQEHVSCDFNLSSQEVFCDCVEFIRCQCILFQYGFESVHFGDLLRKLPQLNC